LSAIAGIITFDGAPVARRQLDLIARPVPANSDDTIATWCDSTIGFAHASALSTRQPQPLVDSASGCVITFDGRLDNRAELFSLRDTRAPDAALILAAYLEWRDDFLLHLRGDFAIAIWDPRTHHLILARDPLGQRALFYACDSTRLIFASTLEQLLADPSISRELDAETLPYYFYAYGALESQTVYRAIKSLPGGSRLIARDGQTRVERYWHWRDSPPQPRALTPNDFDEFRATLTDAITARKRADCPVGLLLSGGLDSGSIASIAGDLFRRDQVAPVRAYSLVFDQFEQCDERRYIEPIIARYNLPFIPVPADDCWTLANWETGLPVFSEPFFEAYDGMKYAALARARADGVRVMLMGHGGDSLLNGSPRAFADLIWQGRWRDLHRELRAFANASGRPYWQSVAGNALSPWLSNWVRGKIEFRFWQNPAPLIPPRLRALHFDAPPKLHRGKFAWWYDLRDQLVNVGRSLHEGHIDRTFRLFGMEIRQPFMDVRLFNLILSLPPEATYSNGTRRFILRAALKDILPTEIYARRDKAEFSPLLHLGLREHRRAFVENLLVDSELARRDLVMDKVWRATVQNYLAGKQTITWLEWRGLAMEIWLRVQTGRLVTN
jgi:asparagine synthase (glutamine-hydrolysing)